MAKQEKIIIVGAGLCGSLLGLRMAQLGYEVVLVERRPDLRTVKQAAGRSINLALSNRGFAALDLAGMKETALEIGIPMYGRMLHNTEGETYLSRYSGRKGRSIYSTSRTHLNQLLLEAASEQEKVSFLFDHTCTNIDFQKRRINVQDNQTGAKQFLEADYIFGTDGAGSVIRESMVEKGYIKQHDYQILSHGYKELFFPALAGGEYAIEKNALHIWPRKEFMLIALPNPGGSFTVTLFLAHKGKEKSFETLLSPEKLETFFKENFADALEIMPDLHELFNTNPTSILGTIKCSPWLAEDRVLLMGDAAHAMVPFYGQGMNAAFEDVLVFDKVLKEADGDLEKAFANFESIRYKDAEAICDLSLDNFKEMQADTADPDFLRKRRIEMELEASEQVAYFSKYSLVTFQEDFTYSEALRIGRAQDKAILELLKENKLSEDMPVHEMHELIKERAEILL